MPERYQIFYSVKYGGYKRKIPEPLSDPGIIFLKLSGLILYLEYNR